MVHYVTVKGILSAKNGMNIYRGCTHGCIYCDSRSACYNFGHAFEDVEVKENAVELLDEALRRKRRPCMIGTGSMTDPYIPLEQKLGNFRRALEVIYQRGFGVALITKSALVLRDIALLQRINERAKCVVQMTLTTADEKLCRRLEPNVSTTRERVDALMRLKEAGIPTVVWLAPLLPFINDTEKNISDILDCCAEAGVYGIVCFGMGMTLREGSREYFYAQLDRLFPGLKEKYIHTYGGRYELTSPNAHRLWRLFREKCAQDGIVGDQAKVFNFLTRLGGSETVEQLSMW